MILDKTLSPPVGDKALPKKPYDCKWEDGNPPLLVRAMVSTRDSLFVAGPKDVMDEKDYYFRNAAKNYEQLKGDLKKQADIWRGKGGGLLHAVSKKDRTLLGKYKLDAIPVFDGMIATDGKLFLSLTNGRLVCLGAGPSKEK